MAENNIREGEDTKGIKRRAALVGIGFATNLAAVPFAMQAGLKYGQDRQEALATDLAQKLDVAIKNSDLDQSIGLLGQAKEHSALTLIYAVQNLKNMNGMPEEPLASDPPLSHSPATKNTEGKKAATAFRTAINSNKPKDAVIALDQALTEGALSIMVDNLTGRNREIVR